MSENVKDIILVRDVESAEKEARELKKATNKAQSLIRDAKARYIKSKTHARSKKVAEEKNAVLQAPRYKVLEMYDRREDIQEAYGCDCITSSERDRLEDLWDEREAVLKNTGEDGVYSDLVTQALEAAENAVVDLWFDQIYDAEQLRKEFDKQVLDAEEEYKEWKRKQDREYEKIISNM